MAINKVIFNNTTLVDITSDTVSSSSLLSNITATASDGNKISGSYPGPSGSITLSSNGQGINISQYATVNVSAQMADFENPIIDRTLAPAYYNSEVDHLYNNAFAGCSGLLSVDFPNVSEIGGSCFNTCDNLEFANFPKLNAVDQYGFYCCYKLSSINAPNLEYINAFAFANTGLVSISFPHCKYIGQSAFYATSSLNITQLTSSELPAVTYIGASAFYGKNTISFIDLPTVKQIMVSAFASCTNLESASFQNIEYIGTQAFANCNKLTNLNISNVVALGNSAFLLAGSYITSLSLSKLISVGQAVFSGALSLTYFRANIIKSANSTLFSSCANLSTIRLDAIEDLNYSYIFRGCSRLLSLYLLGSRIPPLNSTAFTSTPMSTYTTYTNGEYGKIYVRASLYDSWLTTTNWTLYSARIVSLTDAEIEALDQS